MSLIVNTNMSSLTAQRSIASSDQALETAMERLSSGKRINSASDDAAGLAIVERMTAQIKGLNMAVKNANDGIAMTQSIEGALVEVTDMLQRIRELAVQSANDTNTSIDRRYLQEEIVLLQAELSRVASNTRYNGQLVLDGNYLNKKLQVGTEGGEAIAVSISSVSANALGAYTKGTTAIAAIAAASAVPANTIDGATDSLVILGGGSASSLTITDTSSAKAVASQINGVTGSTGVSASAKTHALIAFGTTGSFTFDLNGTSVGTFSASATNVNDAVAKINSVSGTTGVTAAANAAGTAVMLLDADGDDITIFNKTATASHTMTVEAYEHDGSTGEGTSVTLAVYVSGSSTSATRVLGNMSLSSSSTFSVVDSSTLGYFTSGDASLSAVSNVNLSTQTGANSAIAVVDGAIEKVSSMRASLGAIENRLEHTVSNLMNIAENTQDSRSRILDADFSIESANLAKAQVLQQVGAAMLTQANARPQLVLQLLQ
jgi:flagellin